MNEPHQHYFRAISGSLPSELAQSLEKLVKGSDAAEKTIEYVIRLVCGAECPAAFAEGPEQWSQRQTEVKRALDELMRGNKRLRDDDLDGQSSKRQRLDREDDDAPLFKLHSVSSTSPVRKKVDIFIHKSTVKFINPTSQAVEATVPISYLKRAFVLPTRGKQKPHWTVVIIASDVPDRGTKATKNPTAGQIEANSQIIFGMDASAAAALTTTDFVPSSEPTVQVTKKGAETFSIIELFLSRLSVPVFQPTLDVFKSNCAPGVPGLEAYLGAKPGTLWFFNNGILWGEAKPCEFWAVEDLLEKNGGEAVRVVTATGRMCSVFLTRKGERRDENDEEDEDEEIGDETQFGMIDGREQEGIGRWVMQRRHLFGRDPGTVEPPSLQKAMSQEDSGSRRSGKKSVASSQPVTIHQLLEDGGGSDESDHEFKIDSNSDDSGGSGGEDSSNESDDDDDDGEGDDSDAEGEDDPDAEGSDEELDPKHHPLLRPGAMPRMSRAAQDMVVQMMENDLGAGPDAEGDDEEDELED
ncbi:hypothetical protein C8J56DRAFT_1166834 [Mycena floridula]|nr:hypothetical protein C8J56DRAFT_1166834 [Mycena floridula]